MKKTLLFFLLFSLLLFTADDSFAALNGTGSVRMGADAAKEAFSQLLLAPPFPDLDGGSLTFTPLIGIVKVKASNDQADELDALNPGNKFRYAGEVKGHNAGLGVTVPTTSDFGFFGFVVGSKLKGDFTALNNGEEIETMKDIETTGAAVVLGAQYRLIGDDESFFAMGIFGGPGYYQIKSKMNYTNVGLTSDNKNTVKFDPSGLGAMLGLQFMFRIWNFRINPYLLAFAETSDSCKKIDISATATLSEANYTCGGKTGHYDDPFATIGTGLIVGYKSLRINLAVQGASATSYVEGEATNLSVGISF